LDLREIDRVAVKGFLDPEEGRALYDLARKAGSLGPVLEIGGYCGKSTLYLGLGCRASGGILFSVDHHRGSEEQQPGQPYFDPDLYDPGLSRVDTFPFFRRAVEEAELEDTVVPVVAQSRVAARMWSTPLAMLFIDGGHTYEAAFDDYVSWSGHVQPGGILAVHDVFLDPRAGGQAPRFVYSLAIASGLYEELPMVKTLGILRRRAPGDVPVEISSRRDW
jgi:predicted O-methyltransferase YrrM